MAACASSRVEDEAGFDAVNDPIEPLNRAVFQLNQAVDFLIIRPVSATYRQVVPDPIQQNVTNVLRNLSEPINLINNLLQGDWKGAEVAAMRFFLNSTIGVAGLVDIAGYEPELAYQAEDFGQTLAVWGVGEGPYLVLPLIGPSNPRDALGIAVDTVADPVRWAATEADVEEFNYVRLGLSVVDARARSLDTLDELERGSLDYYATLRSLYRQFRRSEISDGAPPEPIDFPEFEDFEDFDDFDDDVDVSDGDDFPAGNWETAWAPPDWLAAAGPLDLDLNPLTDGIPQ